MYELMPHKLTVNLPRERSMPRGGLSSLLLCLSQDEYSNKDGLGVGGFPLLVNLLGTSKTLTSSYVINTKVRQETPARCHAKEWSGFIIADKLMPIYNLWFDHLIILDSQLRRVVVCNTRS